jgi:GGDEF domain-containing protein
MVLLQNISWHKAVDRFLMTILIALGGVLHPVMVLSQTAATPLTMSVGVYRAPMGVVSTVQSVASLNEAAFAPVVLPSLMEGTNQRELWLRVRIASDQSVAENALLLDFHKAFIDRINVYTRQKDGSWRKQQAGDWIAHTQWAKPSLTPQFPLSALNAGQNEVLVQIVCKLALRIELSLVSTEQANHKMQTDLLLYGTIFGLITLMALASMLLASVYRNITYVWYAGYAASMLFLFASFFGVGQYAMWPAASWWPEQSVGVFLIVVAIFQLLFCRSMFLSESSPVWLRRCVGIPLIISLASVLIYIFIEDVDARVFLILSNPTLCSFMMCFLVGRAISERQPMAWLWAFAYVPLMLVSALTVLDNLAFISLTWLPSHSVLYAVLFEMPLLLAAMHLHAQRQYANKVRMQTLAGQDPLTGFVSASQFSRQLAHLCRQKTADHGDFALAYVEIFPLGSAVRDFPQLTAERLQLRAVRLLRTVAREQDTVAHADRHIFAICMPDVSLGADLNDRLARLVALANMTDHESRAEVPLRLHIAATSLASFPGNANQMDISLKSLLREKEPWLSRSIRFISGDTNESASVEKLRSQSFRRAAAVAAGIKHSQRD